MKCNSCGTEIESGVARCPHCAADVGGDSASGAAVRLKTNRSIRFYVIFGVVPIVMVIIPLVYVFERGAKAMQVDNIDVFDIILPVWCGLTYLCWMAFVVYHFCVLYKIIKEVNIACGGDGEKTTDLGVLFLLNYATLGVYCYIWCYKFGKRLAKNAPRYGMDFKKLGRTLLAVKISKLLFALLFCAVFVFFCTFDSSEYGLMATYQIFFSLLLAMAACLVGVVVFRFALMGSIFKYTNKICAGYNAAHRLLKKSSG